MPTAVCHQGTTVCPPSRDYCLSSLKALLSVCHQGTAVCLSIKPCCLFVTKPLIESFSVSRRVRNRDRPSFKMTDCLCSTKHPMSAMTHKSFLGEFFFLFHNHFCSSGKWVNRDLSKERGWILVLQRLSIAAIGSTPSLSLGKWDEG